MAKNKVKVRTFELLKGLFITPQNYQKFEDCLKKALRDEKEEFAFPNHKGVIYMVKVEYVQFVWNMMNKMDADELIEKSNEFDELDEDFKNRNISEDELIKKQTEMRDEAQEKINKSFK